MSDHSPSGLGQQATFATASSLLVETLSDMEDAETASISGHDTRMHPRSVNCMPLAVGQSAKLHTGNHTSSALMTRCVFIADRLTARRSMSVQRVRSEVRSVPRPSIPC